MSNRKNQKPFWKMSAAELARAAREFDHPLKNDAFGPPTPPAKAQLARARKRSGRNGMVRVIRVALEDRLLARSDAFARKHGLTRSQLIASGLRAILSATDR